MTELVDPFDLAWRHRQAGRVGAAMAVARAHLDDARMHHLLATFAFEAGSNEEAARYLRHAVVLAPDNAAYLHDLGVALRAGGAAEKAVSVLRRALRLEPAASTLLSLGHLFARQGARDEAARAFRLAVVFQPGEGAMLMALANCLQLRGEFALAEPLYRRTIRCAPNSAEAHKNMAVALCERGDLDEAEGEIRQAVRHQPGDAAWRMALGQILLLRGRYEEGWKQYEWRWRAGSTRPRPFPQPEWAGQELGGGTLLIHAEQGLGDTLQFCRYATLAAKKARVILEVQPPLKSLLAGLEGVTEIVAAGAPLPPFDRHIPLLSLPRIFKTVAETIPGDVPYLKADPVRRARWAERLADRPGVNVGLVWAGGVVTPRNPQRSIAPHRLAPLAGIPGVNFVSLQKYHSGADRTAPPAALGLVDWTEELEDFAETASLIDALDLVISVDTAVAHLGGALGKPVWLLNRFFPCWRWLQTGDDSRWYPTLRQFRQTSLDDWDEVIGRVRDALASHMPFGKPGHSDRQAAYD